MLRQAAGHQPTTPFSAAHKAYVQSLYRRYLRNELDWCIRRDIWRDRAIEIRAEFERNRQIANPRELARVLQQAEESLRARQHPDPYRREFGTTDVAIMRAADLAGWQQTQCRSSFLACVLIPLLFPLHSSTRRRGRHKMVRYDVPSVMLDHCAY